MNPYSDEMMKTYYAYRTLAGLDSNCSDYIEFAQNILPSALSSGPCTVAPKSKEDFSSDLKEAIVKGLKDRSASLTRELLASVDSMDIVQNEIIPALDTVGAGFEKKSVYLPQLLMSAEAAKSAFEVIKESMTSTGAASKCRIVIATVKGDIHDIGKNIVKLILENYGFDVTDLGRDVAPERVVEEAIRLDAEIVGLSALMTTTLPAMEETVKQLRKSAPQCKVIVGGAVLNKEYAASIGADKYAKDAMEAVRYAEEVNESLKK